ncbi:hypothetical protein JMJ56_00010 [Belnapia sp. T18]|uniref:Metal-dependent HD superfamily phosphohydrolase n=1 Tax=Belnapia arida TaxID=2804533 RepID=A0ABS1TV87_9PROT|nr:hypothetical protein [Belnapia arida]MBL6076362.1 hypothetical protein [Belnapia arida]
MALNDFADLLAGLPVSGAARGALAARMTAPERHYHGAGHLAVLWARHREFSEAAGLGDVATGRLIACAIAYHDAVYDAARRDNEARSAELWHADAAEAGLPEGEIDWVAGTILATADHLGYRPAPGEPDEAARLWMLDLDLTPLGEAPEAFDRNTALLREEYGHLDAAKWEAGRRAFLAGLRAWPQLYRTPVLAAAFEAAARRNIARELGGAMG